jgi:hypothetical protein
MSRLLKLAQKFNCFYLSGELRGRQDRIDACWTRLHSRNGKNPVINALFVILILAYTHNTCLKSGHESRVIVKTCRPFVGRLQAVRRRRVPSGAGAARRHETATQIS